MKINQKKVQKLAKLAKLDLSKDKASSLLDDFRNMLGFINSLDEVNVENVAPLVHIHEKFNIYREDVSKKSNIKSSALKQSKNYNSDYFKVPKVIKKK
mgnify:CR=1 FL=1|tara:strand:+ start:503 stop:796 length:294 start_codon:yes stop_codon:yes gene_type:complete